MFKIFNSLTVFLLLFSCGIFAMDNHDQNDKFKESEEEAQLRADCNKLLDHCLPLLLWKNKAGLLPELLSKNNPGLLPELWEQIAFLMLITQKPAQPELEDAIVVDENPERFNYIVSDAIKRTKECRIPQVSPSDLALLNDFQRLSITSALYAWIEEQKSITRIEPSVVRVVHRQPPNLNDWLNYQSKASKESEDSSSDDN